MSPTQTDSAGVSGSHILEASGEGHPGSDHGCGDRGPRFPPVSPGELGSVVLEVSILTKPEVIRTSKAIDLPSKVRIGVDGLIVSRFGLSGLLLPQVATGVFVRRDRVPLANLYEGGAPSRLLARGGDGCPGVPGRDIRREVPERRGSSHGSRGLAEAVEDPADVGHLAPEPLD